MKAREAIVRTATQIGGKEVYLRDYYTGRSPARLAVTCLSLLLWCLLAAKLFSPQSVERASAGAVVVGVIVLAVLGVAPFILISRVLRGMSSLVQVDSLGISDDRRFVPWTAVSQVNLRYHPAEWGYQLEYYVRGSGLRRLLPVDHALGPDERDRLMESLRSLWEASGWDIELA